MSITTKQQRQQRRNEALKLIADGVPPTDAATQLAQTWDYPGRTRGAEGRKKSGPMTAKNLVYESGFSNGAKRIRTADPLHAMQILRLEIRCAAVSFKSETQSYNWTLNGLLGGNRPEKYAETLNKSNVLQSRSRTKLARKYKVTLSPAGLHTSQQRNGSD